MATPNTAKAAGVKTSRYDHPLSLRNFAVCRRNQCDRLCAAEPVAADAADAGFVDDHIEAGAESQSRLFRRLAIRPWPFHHRSQLDRQGLHLSGSDAGMDGLCRGGAIVTLSGSVPGLGSCYGMVARQEEPVDLHPRPGRSMDRHRMVAQLGVQRVYLEPPVRDIAFWLVGRLCPGRYIWSRGGRYNCCGALCADRRRCKRSALAAGVDHGAARHCHSCAGSSYVARCGRGQSAEWFPHHHRPAQYRPAGQMEGRL